MQHRTQNDLETADFTSVVNAIKTPEGLCLGMGKTVGNGVEGWAPNALFVHTDGSVPGDDLYRNVGTSSAADWEYVGNRVLVPVTKSADYTVTVADSGKTFLTGAVDLVFTLPPTEAGLWYRFVAETLSAVTGLSVSPNASDKITGLGVTPLDDKDIINTAGTDAVGDFIELVGDGVDGWFIVASRGTWARQA